MYIYIYIYVSHMYVYIHAVECVYMYVYVGKIQFQMQLLHCFSESSNKSNHHHISTLSSDRRRPIRCLRLQVIFRKRTTNYRALLREMIYEDKASYDSSPPCTRYKSSCRQYNLCKDICLGPGEGLGANQFLEFWSHT